MSKKHCIFISFFTFFALLSKTKAQLPTIYNTLFEDEFYANTLHPNWQSKAADYFSSFDLTNQNGYLYLFCNSNSISKNNYFNLITLKALNGYLVASTTINFTPKINGEEAGLSLYIDNNNYLIFDLKKEDDQNVVQIQIKNSNRKAFILKDLVLTDYNDHIELQIKSFENNYYFSYRLKSNDLWAIVDKYPLDKILIPQKQLYIGMYASSNGQKSKNHAAFDLFRYYDLKN